MSPPWMRVDLSSEEDQTLQELSRATTVAQRPRERAQALRLSHRGWKPEQIAEYFGWKVGTARKTIHRWTKEGLMGLWDEPRAGRPRRWTDEDLGYVTELLSKEDQTYTSTQLVKELAEERQVELSPRQLRRLLKKKDFDGSELVSLIVASKIR